MEKQNFQQKQNRKFQGKSKQTFVFQRSWSQHQQRMCNRLDINNSRHTFFVFHKR